MKATLTFDLPEEEELYKHSLMGGEYYSALFDFYYNTIRKRTKYCEHSDCCHELLNKIKEEFFEELKHRGIEV